MSLKLQDNLVDLLGRHLPTPIIDVVRLETVDLSDEDFGEIIDKARMSAKFTTAADKIRDQVASTTRMKFMISVLFSTVEGFDAQKFSNELFSARSTVDGGSTEPLFINLIIAKNGVGDQLKKSRLALKSFMQPQTGNPAAAFAEEPAFASEEGGSAHSGINDVAEIMELTNPSGLYVITIPLSEFYDTVRFTTTFDKDENPIIRMSQIEIDTYILDFSSIDEMTAFAAISVGDARSPNGPMTRLSTAAYTLNFSDVSYEQIRKDNSLITYGDASYVDSDGVYYPNPPLKALNGKFYKTDNFGSFQIQEAVSKLLSEYKSSYLSDLQMREIIDEINMMVYTHKDSLEFLKKLEQAADVFPEQVGASQVSALYERFRRVVFNADQLLMQQDEVIKRIFKNYKIVDARAFTPASFDATSFIDNDDVQEFIYVNNNLFVSAVAKYVPIANQSATYPGAAELPVSPVEREEVYRAKRAQLMNELDTLLSNHSWFDFVGGGDGPTTDWDDVSFTTAEEQAGQWGLGGFAPPLARPEVAFGGNDTANTFILKVIASSARRAFDWAFNNWAGRFVYATGDLGTGYGEYHSGWRTFLLDHPWGTAPDGKNWGDGCGDDIWRPASWKYAYRDLMNFKDAQSGNSWSQYNDAFGIDIPNGGSGRDGASMDTSDWQRTDFFYENVESSCTKITSTILSRCDRGEMYSAYQLFGADSQNHPAKNHPHPGHTATNLGNDSHAIDQITVFVPRRAGSAGDSMTVNPPGTSAEWWTFDAGDMVDYDWAEWLMENHVERIGGINPITMVKSRSGAALGEGGEHYPERKDAPSGIVHIVRKNVREVQGQIIQILSKMFGIDPITGQTSIDLAPSSIEYPTTNPSDAVLVGIGGTDSASNEYATYQVRMNGTNTTVTDSDLVTAFAGGDGSTLSDDELRALKESMGINPDYTSVNNINSGTELDEYLKDLPGQIGKSLYLWLKNEINKLSGTDLNTASERQGTAEILSTGLLDRLGVFLDQYLSNRLCTLILATGVCPENASFNYKFISNTWKTAHVHNIRTRSTNGVWFPYGDYAIQDKFQDDDSSRGEDSATSSSRSYQVISFGNDAREFIRNKIMDNLPRIKEIIQELLIVEGAYEGFSSDTGVHSALAETDIIVKKYGTFFFDMEKYIRKRSVIAKFLNVDRLMAYMPEAQAITNAAIKMKECSYYNHNWPARGDFYMRLKYANVTNVPYNYDFLQLVIPTEAINLTPLVYNRVNILNDITFDEITDTTYYTSGGTPETDSPMAYAEIDMQYLAESKAYDEFSHLVQRSYGFPGFEDVAFGSSRETWINNYRLFMFYYQYFTDDDQVFAGNDTAVGDEDYGYLGEDGFNGGYFVDKYSIDVKIQDNSDEIILALGKKYRDIYTAFIKDYYEFAEENCSFNDFTTRFNNFFVETMLTKHPTPRESPWFRMVAVYHLYQLIFSDVFGGEWDKMMQTANNMLEMIRPETGTLQVLVEFKQQCEIMSEKLTDISAKASDYAAAIGDSRDFRLSGFIKDKITDHIGDYTRIADELSLTMNVDDVEV